MSRTVPAISSDAGRVGESHRPEPLHRLPRLSHGLQVGKSGAALRQPHVRQIRRRRRLSPGPARVPGHALQSMRGSAVHVRVPDRGDVPARRRHRRFRQIDLHRLQGVHRGLPLRRDLHQPRGPFRGEVQLLRAADRHRPRAGVRGRLSGGGDPRRRPQRSALEGRRDRRARSRSVRRPEKETRPKLFYKGAHHATLDPLAARQARRRTLHVERARLAAAPSDVWTSRSPPTARPLHVLAYDVPHRMPWDWRLSLYTWTKGIAAGAYLRALAAGPRRGSAGFEPALALRRAHRRWRASWPSRA